MSLSKRVLFNTANYGVGSVLPKVIGFFLIPLYTIYLTPDDYGIVELCTAFGGFLVVLLRLGVNGCISRFYFDYEDGPSLQSYLSTIFWFLAFSSLFVGILVFISSYFYLEKLIPQVPFYPFIVLVIFTSVVRFAANIQRQLITVREQSKYSAILNTVTAFFSIGLVLLLVVGFKMGALSFVLGGAISAFIFSFQSQFYLREDIKCTFSLNLLKPSLIWAVAIFPSHIMSQVSPLISKGLLANYDTLASVGILGIALRFTSPLLIAVGAFTKAYLPIYYSIRKENTKEGLEQLERLSKNIWALACTLFLSATLILPPLIKLVTPSGFHGAADIIWILAIGFILNVVYVLYGVEIFYSKKIIWHPLMSAIAIGVNLLFVFLFIEKLGVYAVATGMTLFWVVFALFGTIISRRIFKVPVDKLFYVKSVIGIVLVLSLYWLVEPYLKNVAIKLLLGISITIMFGLTFKKTLGINLFNEIF